MVDKAMKSLEEVIKYKLNFLPVEIEPFYAIQTYRARKGPNPPPSHYDIYRTKNTIFSNDSISFMEDITPLFIYISSCDKYYRENGHGKITTISIFLSIPSFNKLMFGESSIYDNRCDDLGEHRISDFKRKKNALFSSLGFCTRYMEPFKILIEGTFKHFRTEEERLELERQRREFEEASQSYSGDSDDEEASQSYSGDSDGEEASQSYSDDSDDEEKEELSINDFKTFKSNQCVICLEKEPKVLFCNCGHICICEKCLVRRHDVCPVCKKETTILRIIE